MWKLVAFFILAALAAWFATWFANNPGMVVIEWLDWRIETGVGILVVAALVLCAAAILLFEAVRWLFGLPRRWRERRRVDRALRGYRALTSGLVAAAAGDPAGARYFARQAEKLLAGNDPATHLLEAQRAQLEGDEESALREFRAMLKEPETELLGLRGLLAHAMKAGDYEEALALARRAYRRSASTPWVLVTLFDLATRQGEWQEALTVLNQLADLKLVTPEVARRRRAILYAMMAEEADRTERYDEALRLLKRAFKLVPGFAPVAVRYARMAQKVGRPRLARRVLEKAWKIEPHPDIARAYLGLRADEPATERVRAAQRLRSLQPYEPLAYVVLAEAEMAVGAIDAARHALQRAIELGPTARVYRTMAELERLAGAPEAKVQEWLAKAFEAQPDKAWVCEDTGELFPEWRPFGASGRFDAVQWSTPPRVARLAPGETPAAFITHTPGGVPPHRAPVPTAAGDGGKPERPATPAAEGKAAAGAAEGKAEAGAAKEGTAKEGTAKAAAGEAARPAA